MIWLIFYIIIGLIIITIGMAYDYVTCSKNCTCYPDISDWFDKCVDEDDVGAYTIVFIFWPFVILFLIWYGFFKLLIKLIGGKL